MVRSETVEQLVSDALDAISAIDHTDAEAMSAVFTIALRVINVVKTRAPEHLPILRQAVEALWLSCADTRTAH